MNYPRRSNNNWKDCQGRQWKPAGRLPEWEQLDNYAGIPYYVMINTMQQFPEVEDVLSILHKKEKKTIRVLELLDVSSNGFKSLYLVSEL